MLIILPQFLVERVHVQINIGSLYYSDYIHVWLQDIDHTCILVGGTAVHILDISPCINIQMRSK